MVYITEWSFFSPNNSQQPTQHRPPACLVYAQTAVLSPARIRDLRGQSAAPRVVCVKGAEVHGGQLHTNQMFMLRSRDYVMWLHRIYYRSRKPGVWQTHRDVSDNEMRCCFFAVWTLQDVLPISLFLTNKTEAATRRYVSPIWNIIIQCILTGNLPNFVMLVCLVQIWRPCSDVTRASSSSSSCLFS